MHEPVATLNRKLNYLLAETDAAYHDLALKLGLADSTMMILYALIDAQGRCPLQSLYRGTGQSAFCPGICLRASACRSSRSKYSSPERRAAARRIFSCSSRDTKPAGRWRALRQSFCGSATKNS